MTDADILASIVNNIPASTSPNYGYLVGDGGGCVDEENDEVLPLKTDDDDDDLAIRTELESNTSEETNSESSQRSSASVNERRRMMESDYVIKLRGLPWSCTKDDIAEFLGTDCKFIGEHGIHLITTAEGKASGEAMVELVSEDDQDAALKKDKRNMGHRYIEVFKIKRAELEWVLKRSRPSVGNGSYSFGRSSGGSETYVRLRGLPYECTKDDIHHFFHGLEIVANGIQLMVDGMGRSSGEAYVQFTSKDQAQKALGKDRDMIKHRYVEIFTVSPSELRNAQSLVARSSGRDRGSGLGRPSPYDRPSSKGGGGESRYGTRQRYFNKGFDNDSWGFDSWSGGSGRSNSMQPPPLIPGLRRSRELEGNTRHCVLMRGLPFRADENDIRRFFSPLSPTAVHIIYESNGRPSGTAKVNFASNDDVTRAMAKHKDRMEHRYIELFVHRT